MMGKVVEKVSKDVMEAIEGEKTYGEMIEMGKDDLKLLGEAVDTAKMKEGVERVYQDMRRRTDYGLPGILVLGGEDSDDNTLNSVELYGGPSRCAIPPLPEPVSFHSTTVVQGSILSCGGRNSSGSAVP